MADFIHPSVLANPANILPPAPSPAPIGRTTLAKEGVEMAPAQMELLSKLAAERDGQLGQNTATEVWRDLFDRARCLFREAALPNNVSRLLTRIFSVRPIPGNHCESVITRVLAKAQK